LAARRPLYRAVSIPGLAARVQLPICDNPLEALTSDAIRREFSIHGLQYCGKCPAWSEPVSPFFRQFRRIGMSRRSVRRARLWENMQFCGKTHK
jgi:hypothetical protein